MKMKKCYWDWRFKKGAIYGLAASGIMLRIVNCLAESRRIIVAGGGYGRNAAFLANRKFSIVSTDISSAAIKLGRNIFKENRNLKFSMIDISKKQIKITQKYDSILCIYLLSLLREKELKVAFQNFRKFSNNKGYIVLNFLSTKDGEYGNGEEIGKNEFLFHKEQYVKFYTKKEVVKLLEKEGFKIKNIFKYKEERFINILDKNIITVSWVVVFKM
jgi:SAM-dependent methyltransferase